MTGLDQRALVRRAAGNAYKAGICVLPAAADGSKRPGVPAWAQYQKQRPRDSEMHRLFPAEGGPVGLGFVTGAVSGHLELFEFDDAQAEADFRAIAAEDAELGRIVALLDRCYSERTPNGGLHWLYRAIGGARPNTKLAMRGGTVAIETRGEGGWVVVAPSGGSTHPTGKPYEMLHGGPFTIPALAEADREVLWAVARSLNERKDTAPNLHSAPAGESVVTGDRPGDRFNATATWESILEPAGWRLLYRHGREGYWAHPDAPGGHGAKHDATTDAHDHPYFYVFSTNAPPFDADRGYDKLGTYALLHHGGDLSAAARAIAEMPEYGGAPYVDPIQLPKPLPASPVGAASEAAVVPADAEWMDVPLGPPAPVVVAHREPARIVAEGYDHAFPPGHFVTRWIKWAMQQTDAAAEYHEAAALVALAAFTPTVRVILGPWPDGLPTNLYVMLIGQSSTSRKSTAMKFATRALKGVRSQVLLPDRMSPEAFIEQMSYRTEGGAVWKHDELGKSLSEWATAGKPQNAQMRGYMLSAYDAEPIRYARHTKRVKGGDTVDDEDVVDKSHLSMLGAATPSIYGTPGLADMAEDGLLPRFAIVMGRTRPPRMRLSATTSPDMAEWAALEGFLAHCHEWTALRGSRDTIRAVFEADAQRAVDEYDEMMQGRSETYPILGRISPMAIKVAMLSAAGHMSEPPRGDTLRVTLDDVESGQVVANRWADNAVEFMQELAGGAHSQAEQKLVQIAAFVAENGSASRSEVMRRFRLGAFATDEVRKTLEQRGQLEVVLVDSGSPKARKPIETWTRSSGLRGMQDAA